MERARAFVRLAALVAALTTWASVAAAAGVVLEADAGLGGVGRPGRWMPVRVLVVNTGDDLAGELVLTWGDTVLRRPLTLAAASRKQFELYVRTTDVRDVVAVRVDSAGATIASLQAPVRIIGFDQPVTVCVATADGRTDDSADCTVALPSLSAPRSWRGYDAADRVMPEAQPVSLDDERLRALHMWRAVHRLDMLGIGSPTGAVPSDADVNRRAQLQLFAYVAAIFVVAAGLGRVRRGAVVFPALAAMVAVASAAALASGAAGAPVIVHHASVLEQFEGVDASIVRARGVVEYPAYDRFELRADVSEGSLNVRSGPDSPAELRYDEDGRPVLSGLYGLGSRQAFTVEGTPALRLLDVSRTMRTVQISNVSSLELTDCEFSAGFDRGRIGPLLPGEAAEAQQVQASEDPRFSCRLAGPVFEFFESRPVTLNGGTRIVLHLIN